MSNNILNLNTLQKITTPYPYLYSNTFVNKTLYQSLKLNWPDFTKLDTDNCGQIHRKNIILNELNYKDLQIHPSYQLLFRYLNGNSFKNFIIKSFPELNNPDIGFIGDLTTCTFEMQICQSTNNYENPIHVDTRKRILHFLLYFGDDDIKKGGEFAIATHIPLQKHSDYKQYPESNHITHIKYFKPEDNLGIIILSQNNSYHKGCNTQGIRRFLYCSFTNKNNMPAWKTRNWSCNKNFNEQLQKDK